MKKLHKGVALLAIVAMSLVGCGGGGGGAAGGGTPGAGTTSGTFIAGTVTTVPNPATGANTYSATIAVKNNTSVGLPITNATVGVNGTTLLLEPIMKVYMGNVTPDASGKFNLSVAASGVTFTATDAAISGVPVVNAPAPFVASAANTVSWTTPVGAPPSMKYAYTLTNNATGTQVFTQSNIASTSVTIPAATTVAGITYASSLQGADAGVAIANAATGSNFGVSVSTFGSIAAQASVVTLPSVPVGVTASVASASQINLAWTAVTGATGYNVYGTTTAGVVISPANKITATPIAATTFTNTGLTAVTPYFYKVTAVNAAGESVGSAEVTATTSAAVVAPAGGLAAPTGVTATAASSNTINVSWSPVTGANAYYVYRAITAGLPIASMVGVATTLTGTFTDVTVVAGTTYYYKIEPHNINFLTGTMLATGPASVEVSATPASLPVAAPIAGLMGGAKQGTPLVLAATVSTFAGSGASSSVDGVGTAASLFQPRGITTDGKNLYVIDTPSSKIRIINIATGGVTTLNTSTYNTANPTGLMAPQDITTDGTYLYVANAQHISRIVIATGASSILAGSATATGATDGVGAAARFFMPYGITTDGKNVYVTEAGNNKVRQIVIATGAVTTLAGSGVSSSLDGVGAAATFTNPRGITTDGTNLYVVEVGTSANVRKIVIATGAVTTVAGSPTLFGSVNGTGTAATFTMPTGITTDGTNLYIADAGAQNIRKVVIATGVVTTLAGTGMAGAVDGAGTAASFYAPSGIITDGVSLYVSDLTNNKIRKIQ